MDLKQKLRRNHSTDKNLIKSDKKSNVSTDRATRTSSVNNGRKEAEISKFFAMCNSNSGNSLSSVSDRSEKSIDSFEIETMKEI
jgi:hypothetical protein